MYEFQIPTECTPEDISRRLELIKQTIMGLMSQSSSPTTAVSMRAQTDVFSPFSTPSHSLSSSSSSSSSSLSSRFSQSPTIRKTAIHLQAQTKPRHPSVGIDGADEADEADGGDGIVHAFADPRQVVTPISHGGALDESDIVRIITDNEKKTQVKASSSRSPTDHSDIVHIFTDKDDDKDDSNNTVINRESSFSSAISNRAEIVRVLTPTKNIKATTSSMNVQIIEDDRTQQKSIPVIQPEKQSISPIVFVTEDHQRQQQHHHQLTPKKTTSPSKINAFHNNINRYIHIPTSSETPIKVLHRGSSSPSSSFPRRSPELPTPPKTPDDAGLAEDDEVFIRDALSSQPYYIIDARRRSLESTPRRDVHLRNNSENSTGSRTLTGKRSSPFSPAQDLAEMHLAEIQHTKKRLSFDDLQQAEDDSSHFHPSPAKKPTPGRYRSTKRSQTPSPMPDYNIDHIFGTPQSLQQSPIESPFHLSPLPSQIQFYENTSQAPVSASLNHVPSFNQQQPSFHSPLKTSSTTHTSSQSVLNSTSRSSHGLNEPDSPFFNLKSDSCHSNIASTATLLPNSSSSFSSSLSSLSVYSSAPSSRLTTAQSKISPEKEIVDIQLCSCSKLESLLPKMAELAYRRIRPLESPNIDSERFVQDLANVNNIVRETILLLKTMKMMCDHKTS